MDPPDVPSLSPCPVDPLCEKSALDRQIPGDRDGTQPQSTLPTRTCAGTQPRIKSGEADETTRAGSSRCGERLPDAQRPARFQRMTYTSVKFSSVFISVAITIRTTSAAMMPAVLNAPAADIRM